MSFPLLSKRAVLLENLGDGSGDLRGMRMNISTPWCQWKKCEVGLDRARDVDIKKLAAIEARLAPVHCLAVILRQEGELRSRRKMILAGDDQINLALRPCGQDCVSPSRRDSYVIDAALLALRTGPRVLRATVAPFECGRQAQNIPTKKPVK